MSRYYSVELLQNRMHGQILLKLSLGQPLIRPVVFIITLDPLARACYACCKQYTYVNTGVLEEQYEQAEAISLYQKGDAQETGEKRHGCQSVGCWPLDESHQQPAFYERP